MLTENLLSIIVSVSPLLFFTTYLFSKIHPGRRPKSLLKLIMFSGWVALAISVYAIYMVYQYGIAETGLFGLYELGLSLRLDALSVLMFTMIALLAFIIIKFSNNYLDGDERQGVFLGRLSATIASVQLLVLSGNLVILLLTWILTSLTLHQLLIFYKERPRAITAARKKFIAARLGDAFLLIASILLYQEVGSGNLEVIFNYFETALAQNSSSYIMEWTAILMALVAVLKSAQFPTHGWLVEVMETPTPVSALLHAGILNAGPFLMVRMAYVMSPSDMGAVLLICIGGFTAFFASVSFLTQTSIKTALGYSSIAHMGFMLMLCGMGLHAAAMLHLVAHSFYKAHAFLSSGSAVEKIRSSRVTLPSRMGSPLRIIASFAIAILIYAGYSYLWGINLTGQPALFIAGIIIILGLAQIIAPALDSMGYAKAAFGACLMAIGVATSFFTLEHLTAFILHSQVPPVLDPGSLILSLMSILLLLFGATVLIQIVGPSVQSRPFWRKLGVHFRNGFYANAAFDRLVGAMTIQSKTEIQN